MLTLYGIPNCETVKKARAWLEANKVAYAFHDYKKQGADPKLLAAWSREIGWESVINRSGTMFRKLDPKLTKDLDQARAIALMVEYPSTIKRPIVTGGPRLIVGFKPDAWAAEFSRPAR